MFWSVRSPGERPTRRSSTRSARAPTRYGSATPRLHATSSSREGRSRNSTGLRTPAFLDTAKSPERRRGCEAREEHPDDHETSLVDVEGCHVAPEAAVLPEVCLHDAEGLDRGDEQADRYR